MTKLERLLSKFNKLNTRRHSLYAKRSKMRGACSKAEYKLEQEMGKDDWPAYRKALGKIRAKYHWGLALQAELIQMRVARIEASKELCAYAKKCGLSAIWNDRGSIKYFKNTVEHKKEQKAWRDLQKKNEMNRRMKSTFQRLDLA